MFKSSILKKNLNEFFLKIEREFLKNTKSHVLCAERALKTALNKYDLKRPPTGLKI